MGRQRHWDPERWVAGPGLGKCGSRPPGTLARLTPASRRGEPSAQTGSKLHGGRTAAARGGGDHPVLGRGRRDSGELQLNRRDLGAGVQQPRSLLPFSATDPGGLRRRDSEALQHGGGQIPGSEALPRRGGHVSRPRPGRRVRRPSSSLDTQFVGRV